MSVLALGLVLPAGPVSDGAEVTGPRAEVGAWTEPIPVGVVGIHAVVLYTGQVLLFERPGGSSRGSRAVLFDPLTLATRRVDVPIARNVYCSGDSALPDGRILVAGGGQGAGGPDGEVMTIFDPAVGTWSDGGRLADSRWYPTNVELDDGTTLIVTGERADDVLTRTMERYDPVTGRTTLLPPTADSWTDSYARMAMLPDGRVFRGGSNQLGATFDPDSNTWSAVSEMNYGIRKYGAMVLLPGLQKVLTAGGNPEEFPNAVAPTETAEVIDMSQASPSWSYVAPMAYPRINLNLVLLADGTVLAVGGNGRNNVRFPVREAELYDPSNDTWSTMAAQTVQRGYYSTAVLLPHSRVLSAGSNYGPLQRTVEIFSPPYLFRGPRPSIASAPDAVQYGATFTIETPDAGDIARVALIKPGAATHGANFDQRYVDLSFQSQDGAVVATAPSSGTEAPPGYYMLVVVDSNGVPSVARFVHLE